MVGDGFRVAQYIPGYGREMTPDTSPFLMLDYNAPWNIPPQKNHRPWVGYHPHRGFETVTIVYSGEIEHADTAWHGGIIWPDEVQWMTAWSGLLHNEFMTADFSEKWWVQHMVQLWVDLPREYKMTEPRYQALTHENIPEVEFDRGTIRVIAGELKMKNEEWKITEKKWAAKTFSPVELYDIGFSSGWNITLTFPEWYNAMILVVEWSVIANEKSLENSDMLYFSPEGTEISLSSSDNAKVLVMAWKPLEQSVVAHGPFVMNTEEEIEEAFRDFRSGKMGRL
jgi:quercetin 2,3-dioxygenase